MKITREFLLDFAPSGRPEIIDGIVKHQNLLTEYGIIKPEHLIDFLAQTAEETGGFNRLEENLTYTTVKRLRQVWPARFKSDEAAAPYVRNPEKLANLVYGGRYGNDNAGDGWRYRGSSLIQTTFEANYEAVAKSSGLDCVKHPELLRQFPGALVAACVFWRDHGLNRFAEANDFVGETKVLNGGTTNLAARQVFRERVKQAMTRHYGSGGGPAPVDTSGWLRRGSMGPRVTAWQQRLRALGYYKGVPISGAFDEATDAATRHFQTVKGLVPVDGVVGPATQRAADGATPEANPPAGPVTLPAPVEPQGIAALIVALLKLLFGALAKKG